MKERFVLVNGNKIRYLDSDPLLDDNDGIDVTSSIHTHTDHNHSNPLPILVLVHGLGASAERWKNVMPLLARHFRLIIPDLIGFGYSDKPATDYTMDFFSEFLSNFLIAINVPKSLIIGSSLGGQITAEFTSKNNSRVEKLVIVSPSGIMKTSTPALDAYIMAALYPSTDLAKQAFESMSVSSEDVPQFVIDGFVERMKLPNAKLAFMSTLLSLKNSNDFVEKLKDIAVPTLLIWGKKDPVIPEFYREKLLSSIPQCQYISIAEAGHTPYVDNPTKFADAVIPFLKS